VGIAKCDYKNGIVVKNGAGYEKKNKGMHFLAHPFCDI
jgi:hypothetical protein